MNKINIETGTISSYDLKVGDKFIESPNYNEVWEVLDININPPRDKGSNAEYLCLEAQSAKTGRICYFGHAEGLSRYVNDLYKVQS